MREDTERTASVPLERPVKTSPTTGSTGAPHPTTLHGPVESPRTLANAPTTPPLLDAEARQPETRPCWRAWSQRAPYTPTRSAITTNRRTSIVSTAKPHLGTPMGTSAVDQKHGDREMNTH